MLVLHKSNRTEINKPLMNMPAIAGTSHTAKTLLSRNQNQPIHLKLEK